MNIYCTECQPAGHQNVTLKSVCADIIEYLRYPVKAIQQRLAEKRALKELTSLDDTALRDIGLTRSDLTRVSCQPTLRSPSSELEKIARTHNNF